MKTKFLHLFKNFCFTALCFMLATSAMATGNTRNWLGYGKSGVALTGTNQDFNNAANWDGSGSIAGDNMIMALVPGIALNSINITASVSVASLNVTFSGTTTADQRTGVVVGTGLTFTVTGACTLNNNVTATATFLGTLRFGGLANSSIILGSLNATVGGTLAYINFDPQLALTVNGATNLTVASGKTGSISFNAGLCVFNFNGAVAANTSATVATVGDISFYVRNSTGSINFNDNVNFGATNTGGHVNITTISAGVNTNTLTFKGVTNIFGPGATLNPTSGAGYAKNIVFNGTGTQTFTVDAAASVAFGNFTVGDGVNATALTMYGASIIKTAFTPNAVLINPNATLIIPSTASLNTDAPSSGTFTNNGALILNGLATNMPVGYSTYTTAATATTTYLNPFGTQIVSSLPTTNGNGYGNLVLNGGTKTLTGNIGVQGNVTVTGSTFNLAANTTTNTSGSPTGTFLVSGGSTLRVGGAANFPANFLTYTLLPTSTVTYDGAVTQTVKTGITYGYIKFANTSGGLTYVSGIPSVSSGGIFTSGILDNRSAGSSAAISFASGATTSASSTSSFVNGFAKATSPASGFVLPLGQTTYMPITFAAASSGSVNGTWLDAGAPAAATVGAIFYNLQPGFYDLATAVATSSVTVAVPAGTPAGSHLIGYDGSAYTDFGLITATVTLPLAASYKIYVAQQSNILVNAKAILQGAWGGSTMSTTLNSLHLIPGTQPYSGAPFSYAGSETTNTTFLNANPTIVDWVLVELRDATTPSIIVKQRAAFVGSNGVLLDTNGTVGVKFYNVASANYYISIRHRNHLGIRSTAAQAISSTSAQYDFTTAAVQANGTNAMIAVSGVYCMWGGNTEYTTTGGLQVINYGTSVSDVDFTRSAVTNASGNTLHNAGFAGPSVTGVYSVYDCNLDGNIRYSVSPSDVDLIRTNVTNVPGNGLHNTSYAGLTEKLP